MSDVDVLVVGAGPTGLSLAAQLAAYGTNMRIVDRNLDRASESRALAIQPRTLEVLAGLGVTEELVALGNRAVQLRMHAGRRVVPVELFDIGVEDTAYPFLLFLSQAETERILGEHLASRDVVVERGTQLVHMRQTADAVKCVLRHGDGRQEQVDVGYVVGCDGAHSTVRQQAGIAFEGAAYPQTFVLADLEADGIETGAAHVFLSRHGMLFFFPLGKPATWRMLAMRPRSDDTPVAQPVFLAEVQALADAYTGEGGVRLRDPVWMTNFRLHNRGAVQYRAGRVFLAGDAAHIHSPAGAQGMNTGIQDAVNLGWKLAQVTAGLAPLRLLDTYQPERVPIGAEVLRFTDRAFTIATSTNPLVSFARTQVAPRLIPLVVCSKLSRRYGFRTISQLAISYRRSPLSIDEPHAPRRGPKAGDRMPDAPVIHEGLPTTLHTLLRQPGWHLMLCGPGWPAAGELLHPPHSRSVAVHRLSATGRTDATGKALQRLGFGPSDAGLILVRPDGYIGLRAGVTGLPRLHGYLNRWLQP
ncbi:oxygenase [Rhizocola hellebori]|uniref:Oxygenase n=1 Tax=Rhizocola hellebori TaxID=1392758 RepID=A0A8J3Q572_9ACTN|nr:FAD-dependent monooxygenase [Rhizocola hellebori]GIH03634.1 oxygenase [Rhizocola hellebori]